MFSLFEKKGERITKAITNSGFGNIIEASFPAQSFVLADFEQQFIPTLAIASAVNQNPFPETAFGNWIGFAWLRVS